MSRPLHRALLRCRDLKDAVLGAYESSDPAVQKRRIAEARGGLAEIAAALDEADPQATQDDAAPARSHP